MQEDNLKKLWTEYYYLLCLEHIGILQPQPAYFNTFSCSTIKRVCTLRKTRQFTYPHEPVLQLYNTRSPQLINGLPNPSPPPFLFFCTLFQYTNQILKLCSVTFMHLCRHYCHERQPRLLSQQLPSCWEHT